MNFEKYNGVNRSNRRTKRIFKEKFIELIKDKGYKNVTVSDIVKYADFNRSTFYFYFKDKEDLMDDIMEGKLDDLEASFKLPIKEFGDIEVSQLLLISTALYQHIYDNQKFYDLLVAEDSIPGFYDKFISRFKTLLDNVIIKNDTQSNSRTKHYKIYLTYGIYGMVREWIKNDYDMTPAELAKTVFDIYLRHFETIRLIEEKTN